MGALNSDESLAKLTKHEDEIEVYIQGKVQEWTGATMRPAASPLKDSECFELPISYDGFEGVQIMTSFTGDQLANWMTNWLGNPVERESQQVPLIWTNNLHGILVSVDQWNSPADIWLENPR